MSTIDRNFVFGNQAYAELVVMALMRNKDITIRSLVVDKKYLKSDTTILPQVSLESVERFGGNVYIGFTHQNQKGPEFLKKTINRLKKKGFRLPGFDLSGQNTNGTVGEGVQIFLNSYVDYNSAIGNFVQIRPGVFIGHDCSIGDYSYIAPAAKIGSLSTIGTGCFIGFGSMIAPESNIGHNSVIGAGAIVRGNLPPYSLVRAQKSHAEVVKNPFESI